MLCYCEFVDIGVGSLMVQPDAECPQKDHRYQAYGYMKMEPLERDLAEAEYVLGTTAHALQQLPNQVTPEQAAALLSKVEELADTYRELVSASSEGGPAA